MLDRNETALVIVDVQERLAPVIFHREELIQNLRKLIQGAQLLQIPILLAEQLPGKLGPTVSEVKDLLAGVTPIEKDTFSCGRNAQFIAALRALDVSAVVVAGIEAHVCVYQTVVDLLALEYRVEVVADAVSSRSCFNRDLALEKVDKAGASLTSVEMILFELIGIAGGETFRSLARLIK